MDTATHDLFGLDTPSWPISQPSPSLSSALPLFGSPLFSNSLAMTTDSAQLQPPSWTFDQASMSSNHLTTSPHLGSLGIPFMSPIGCSATKPLPSPGLAAHSATTATTTTQGDAAHAPSIKPSSAATSAAFDNPFDDLSTTTMLSATTAASSTADLPFSNVMTETSNDLLRRHTEMSNQNQSTFAALGDSHNSGHSHMSALTGDFKPDMVQQTLAAEFESDVEGDREDGTNDDDDNETDEETTIPIAFNPAAFELHPTSDVHSRQPLTWSADDAAAVANAANPFAPQSFSPAAFSIQPNMTEAGLTPMAFMDGEDDEDCDEDDDVDDSGTSGDASGEEDDTPATSISSHGYPSPHDLKGDDAVVPRARAAHIDSAYVTSDQELDQLMASADPDFELPSSRRRGGSSKKRKRSTSAHASLNGPGDWIPNVGGSSARRAKSTDRLTSGDSPLADSSSRSSGRARSRSKKADAMREVTMRPYNLLDSNGNVRLRTDVPAIEDDPNVRPYGCNYPECPARLVELGLSTKALPRSGPNSASSWRTIRQLKEHVAEHTKQLLDAGEFPFRCALDPCGKTFKSLAGIRFHFQNASANGHFFVSFEEGEDRPSKKFKTSVVSNERTEHCPIVGCTKSFKQAAGTFYVIDDPSAPPLTLGTSTGLAYHLAHTVDHDVTETMLATFGATLQSKTRWWYAKMGKTIGQ
ncbi:myb-like DNA-binding protein bas1 [Microbotryomycetes sp. JL221]|nr:myb-like DNA-binding protein bas1 [Microbotryomycetes sp. JL221]